MTSHFIAAGNMGHMNPHFMMVDQDSVAAGAMAKAKELEAMVYGMSRDVKGCRVGLTMAIAMAVTIWQ